ncbi:MAG: 50S ribosomal protein L11 methyltransferase [Gammaproteobacteria bacterium]|nr:50S ribosomal protein L11 methyltransferase [Gammaproteobacteria bacterium]
MNWIELHITTTSESAIQLSEKLEAYGAQALTSRDAGNQPIYEPAFDATPSWPDTILIALFDAEQNLAVVLDYLETQRVQGFLHEVTQHHLADQDWERTCLDELEPMCFGKRLWICPSWKKPNDASAINIILDPGLAFGTGTHATTALCLAWLDENIEGNETIIDYGCGSGILALAAIKLGAKHAIAIDHDVRALEVTRTNAERNDVNEKQLKIFFPDDAPVVQVDLLIANILAQPLIELASKFSTLVKSNGKILLSGILAEQADAVAEAYKPWFNMEKPTQQNEWVRLTGVKK